MAVVNSTLSGNLGGGIRNDGTLIVVSSTITGNDAPYIGGGICFVDVGGVLHMHNTIVAGNTGGYSIPDLAGPLTSSGYNLIGDPNGGSGYAAADQLNFDPDLGPLQDNGGSTWTHALLADSPAINAGDPDFDPYAYDPPWLFDQRGSGYARVVGGRIDIGAFDKL